MSSPRTQTLYRPVGLRELELILDAQARALPPRLPDQPLFYPVLHFKDAEQIARNWNTLERCLLEEWRLVFCNPGPWSLLRSGTAGLSSDRIEATLAALAGVWRASPWAGLRLPEGR